MMKCLLYTMIRSLNFCMYYMKVMPRKNCIFTLGSKTMSKMRVKVEGVDEILDALRKADQELRNELYNIVSEAVEIVFRKADATIPIKSGAARESLKIETGTTKRGTFYANVTVGGQST